MELPILAIVAGGFIGDFLVAGALLAGVAMVAAAIAAIVAVVMYARCLRKAVSTSHAWLLNLIASPVVGVALGYVIISMAWGAGQADKAVDQASPLFVVTVLVGLYGFFAAPFHAPILLMTEPGVRGAFLSVPARWTLSYLSFATLGFAWGMVAIGTAQHVVKW